MKCGFCNCVIKNIIKYNKNIITVFLLLEIKFYYI